MTPSRLAFVQQFERELGSISLHQWFEALRRREPAIEGFVDPAALRGLLHRPV